MAAHTMHGMNNMSTTTMAHVHHHPTTTAMNHMGHGMDGMNGGMESGHNHGMNMGNDTDSCMPDMLMYFHTGFCEYVLFEALKTKNTGGVVGACFAIFALAVIYEGLKVLREHLLQRALVKEAKYKVTNGSTSQDTMVVSNSNIGVHMMSCSHLLQTILHMLQVFISYCLMLVFMTYNVWFCLAVIVGAGCGYFLFGWRKAIVVDINEHCH